MKGSPTRPEVHPLSDPQRDIWFDQALHPAAPLYNIGGYVRLDGALEVARFRQRLAHLVARHDALRLELQPGEPEPTQRIVERPLELPVVDLSGLAAPERVAQRLMAGQIARPFALYGRRLFRFALLRLAAQRHYWLQIYHHLIIDGWGIGLVTRELMAASAVSPAADQEAEASYLRFVRDDTAHRSSAAYERNAAFWRQHYRTLPAPLFDGTPEGSRSQARIAILARHLHERLAAQARQRQISPFHLYLGALGIFLCRTRGCADLAVGVPMRNRRGAFRRTVGLFVGMTPVRLTFRAAAPFATWLREIRRELQRCYRHQRFPLGTIQRLAGIRRQGRSRLFDVTLSFESHDYPPQLVTLFPDAAPYALALALREYASSGEARLSLESQWSAFEPVDLARLAARLQILLAALAEDLEQPLSALPLLSRAEGHQLCREWNTSPGEREMAAAEATIPDLFTAQAARTPDAVALVTAGTALTYGALAHRVAHLAGVLRQQGVGPEVRVGIAVERSSEMVVALLAVLQAGGAYVPLDPALPHRRLAFLMADAGIALRLTQHGLQQRLPMSDAPDLLLDRPWPTPAALPPPPRLHPRQLAYVLYTSGSTGRPKGVAITHRSAVALLRWAHHAFDREDFRGVLAATSLSFDLSVFELFAPLTCGGCAVLMGSALELPERAERAAVRLLNTVPSVMRSLLASGVSLPALRTVNLAGEPLSQELVTAIHHHHGTVRIHDLYGPSEDTTYSTWARRAPEGPATIGRPIAGSRALVLDRGLRLTPQGVSGELCLAGLGLARGYLGRSALTAARFVPDPWSGEPGGRLYRSGDLARTLGDGQLCFQGRMDHQVKVRGHRIELGEIEAVLQRHPAVKECAVLAAAPAGKSSRSLPDHLVAYVVTTGEPAPRWLHDHLGGELPAYMIPETYLTLPALPRLPNGKVDRVALAARAVPTASPAENLAPRNPAEELLATIWCDVLGVESLGVDDDVFALGAHSLHASQVSARARVALDAELPMAALFNARTVAAMARLAAQRSAPAALPPIRTASSQLETGSMLSFAQEHLWVLARMEPQSPFYNIAASWHLEGPLQVEALRCAFEILVHRHDVLRTRFVEHHGSPRAIVDPRGRWFLPVVDLGGLAAGNRQRQAERLRRRQARRPFDLGRNTLLRTVLLRLGGDRYQLFLDQHHIVSDGWSMQILAREVERLYTALRQGRLPAVTAPTIQYADFAAWQRHWLQGTVRAELLAYWRGQLAATAPLELATDRPRPPHPSYQGDTHTFLLPSSLTAALRRLSRRHNATLFMTLLAAFQVLLYRLSGQHDVAVGVPVANRQASELEGLVGFFVNTLVLRLALRPAWSFTTLLDRVRPLTLAAYAHQDLPLAHLLEALGGERDLSRTPLFQAMLVHRATPLSAPRLPALRVEAEEVPTGTTKFDLTLFSTEVDGQLRGDLEYATDLFDATTIARLSNHFSRLLQGLAAKPTGRLQDLPLLAPADHHQLLVAWNERAIEVAPPDTLPALVAAQAARTPDAVAIVDGEQASSYGALATGAHRLAHHLRAALPLGGAETRVGIVVERSATMVTALLAILEAGWAYVPLDPRTPRERLDFLIADAGIGLLVSQRPVAARLGEVAVPIVLLDGEQREIAARPATPPAAVVEPASLAYLIYTSGSTGRPKGVAITHGSATALVHWAHQAFARDDLEAVLASTSFTFDLSVFELFAPLSCGGTVVLVPSLLELTRASTATVRLLNTVPSVMEAFLRQEVALPRLRTVNLAGEPLSRQLVAAIRDRFGNVEVRDLYGPSEDTTYTTCARRTIAGEETIGRPLPGTRLLVADHQLRPVPLGAMGELVIGGQGLARGYLGRPALTATQFVPAPEDMAGSAGGRLYRTGDRVRYLADGQLQFRGRIDQQVKVRGFRIEPGEIEAWLARQPAVTACAVVAHRAASGEGLQLVAYVVAAQAPSPADLRALLRRHLPEPLVPAVFVLLPALPLLPSGKIDRAALAQRPLSAAPTAELAAAPRSPDEELVAGIFCEVLARDRIGIAESFFEVGGHSLLATRVIARLRALFDVELPVRTLFETPTVASLAQRIAAKVATGTTMPVPPIVASADGEPPAPLPLSFAQERQWFLHRLHPQLALYNLPAALTLDGALHIPALGHAFEILVRRHGVLRTRFIAQRGEPAQVIAPPTSWALPVIDLSGRPEEADRLLLREARRPFELQRELPLRTLLLRHGAGQHTLFVNLHHIAADGWSFPILVRELEAHYRGALQGRPTSLAAPTIGYGDFAVWQRRWLSSEVLAPQARYWQDQLADLLPLDLPTDRPRPAASSHRGGTRSFHLSEALTRRLRQLARHQEATLFMVLLAAFAALLHRLSGQQDLTVGTPVAHRTRLETEGLIGFFVNTLVLRLEPAPAQRFASLLRHGREIALEAYSHQDLPFEHLVDLVGAPRDLARAPLFQAALVLQNVPLEAPRLAGLETHWRPLPTRTAKFDLFLELIAEQEGLAASLEYAADLFDPTTATRIGMHYERLLEAIAANPECTLGALSFLTPAERHQLLVAWSHGALDGAAEELVPEELVPTLVAARVSAIDAGLATVGRPIRGLRVHITDAALRLVPMGVAGELLIGGAGVGGSYPGQPALTAARFVPDPWAAVPGSRLYRSGARARFLADGAMAFLGRLDRPMQMGKGPDVATAVAADDQAPRTPMEELVAGIFASVLAAHRGVAPPAVGLRSDFFALGGHSLLATQVASRLREVVGVEVGVSELFAHPTVSELAAALTVARQQKSGQQPPPPLMREPQAGDAPLSYAQQRLWLLHQMAPDDPTYHQPLALRLGGEVAFPVLAAALQAIVRRHDTLRTVFVTEAGEPVQRVTSGRGTELACIDLRYLASSVREHATQALLTAEARRPFDLTRGPLFRAHLLELGDRRLLFINQPHIVSDGWSYSIFLRELTALCEAGISGSTAVLPPLRVRYGDFARWQRQWLDDEAMAPLLTAWRQALGDDPPILALPTDRPAPATRTARGRTRTFRWPAALTPGLRELGRRHGATLFMTLLAGWHGLFHRLTGQRRIVIGTPAAHRHHTATENLIGCFINTLALAVDLDGRLTFAELVARVRRAALDAYAGEDLPFEKLVEAVRPDRREARNPLFRVMVALQSFPLPTLTSASTGLELEPMPVDTGTARLDLAFAFLEAEDGALEGMSEHSLDLFDGTTVERMTRHLLTLLRGAVADPGQRLADLPWLSTAEHHQLICELRPRPLATTAAAGIHHRFAAHARATPAAVALIDGAARITYGELAARASRLARALMARGVGPEQVVGLCLERSTELVLGILGILEAGGAYLPLDPALPEQRLAWMLADTAATHVVTVTALAPKLPPAVTALCLDAAGTTSILPATGAMSAGTTSILPATGAMSAGTTSILPATGAISAQHPQQLAYVLYTSGSTGKPKGVGVTHGNIMRLLDAAQPTYSFDKSDVWTLFHSYAFDFSVWELWGPLAHGGSLVVVPFAVSRTPADFHRLLAAQRVTVLNQTPSAFAELVRLEERAVDAGEALPHLALRWVVFGGEALDPSRLAAWWRHRGDGNAPAASRNGGPRLVNMYGITETTVHVTLRPLAQADATAQRGPIGRALPDLAVYLLDAAGHPVATGVAGEILVGGAGPARGYLGRAALTAERFVPDPWSDLAGGRLYRSGDLARRRPDGDLEYLGRIDHQIKIRGFRIELGEIAAVLAEHASVGQAVVLALPSKDPAHDGGPRLVAWVVPTAVSHTPQAEILRDFLKAQLPDYMLPAAFVPLESLPLTANGKLDRAALPDPDATVRNEPEATPRTEIEATIAQLWREWLGIEKVGIHDNFFDLGGHSLLLVRIHERLESIFACSLPRLALFRNPTIASLAEHLVQHTAPQPATPAASPQQDAATSEEPAPPDTDHQRRAEERRQRARQQIHRRRQLR